MKFAARNNGTMMANVTVRLVMSEEVYEFLRSAGLSAREARKQWVELVLFEGADHALNTNLVVTDGRARAVSDDELGDLPEEAQVYAGRWCAWFWF